MADTIHILGPGDAAGACGADLVSASMDPSRWNWTENEAEATCEDCTALYSEVEQDRADERALFYAGITVGRER